ncbi:MULTISPECIES: HTH-type transcriptional regulator MalT [Vibrio]|uniref:HTH-type transcriptional regulator MalT n=1 Tax=Vibrio algicola TaxID=2662262 RepID=A0A5Q0TI74_9VIBR|nr:MULTISPECIES: HTH-type transcriptional regulator MalT [Vibrio]MBD1575935.1 HTH-type transcriptional regulator MalT [Vibrio sp. S11_S32]
MWIPSKLNRPARLHNAILRSRLLEALTHAPYYKLVLFRSPAGYGKTTMAAQWLNNHPNLGWFNIDDSDNDIFRFANYFLQAFNKATDQACPNTQAIAERRQFANLTSLFSELFAEFGFNDTQSYVVLDDYHLITNDEIHEGMRFLLKHMPDNITIVVTSRTHPPLNIANLRVRDQLIEVDHSLLAFDQEETTRFFQKRIADNQYESQVLESLRTQVEGWASALQLIALHVQQFPGALENSAVSIANFNQEHIWDYLAEEVFDQLSSELQTFLLQCSVLDIFNAELVTELTGRADSLAMLDSLNRYGLFVQPLKGADNWYRFHHLFADFLRHRRYSQMPEQRNQLHTNAAKAWLKQNQPQSALMHAQKVANDDLLCDILNQYGWQMFNHGELSTLEKAIQTLSDDALFSSPRLCLLRAWLAQSQHRYNQVADLILEAEEKLAARSIELTDAQVGEFKALTAQVAINQNRPEFALETAEFALLQLPKTSILSCIVATSVIGEVYHCIGQLDRALEMMQQTEIMAREAKVYPQTLWAILQQSEIQLARGYGQAAFELLTRAELLIKEQQLHQLPLHEFMLRIKAQILWCWNRLDEAEQCAHASLDVLAPYEIDKSLQSYSMLARIAISRGELDKAARYLDTCTQLKTSNQYHIDWRANADYSNLLYWDATQDNEAITQWLKNSEEPTEAENHFQQLQWRNIARACMATGDLTRADAVLSKLQHAAQAHKLVSDRNRNLVLEAALATLKDDKAQAMQHIKEALTLTNSTGMIGDFLCSRQYVLPLLKTLSQDKQLAELEQHRAHSLIQLMSSKEHTRAVHFDEAFVEKLLNHPDIPELIRTSPLTQREWQVLGLIYVGFSNDQIASEFDVAPTTIKTHIRNLYQKMGLENRQHAIRTAEHLIHLMGFAA